jgi:hypothetical protein
VDIYFATVDAYNTSLTRSTPASLSTKRGVLAGASVGNYAVFAGGDLYVSASDSVIYSATVDTYNTALEHNSPIV